MHKDDVLRNMRGDTDYCQLCEEQVQAVIRQSWNAASGTQRFAWMAKPPAIRLDAVLPAPALQRAKLNTACL